MSPAERIAGARCILARHRGKATATHPVRCRFCSVDLAQLEHDVHTDGDNEAMTIFMSLPDSHRKKMVEDAAEIPIASWFDEL